MLKSHRQKNHAWELAELGDWHHLETMMRLKSHYYNPTIQHKKSQLICKSEKKTLCTQGEITKQIQTKGQKTSDKCQFSHHACIHFFKH